VAMMHVSETDGNQFETIQTSVEQIKNEVISAARSGAAAHIVEENIQKQLCAMGYRLMEWFFSLQGTGDIGETASLCDGRKARRLPGLHGRKFKTIFGTHHLKRHAYGCRQGQSIDLVPLDTRLQLPKGEYSHVYQNLSQELATEMPYGKAGAFMRKIFSGSISVDTLETANRHFGSDAALFRETRPAPVAETEAELLVTSADGKGIPMRHERDVARIEDLRHKRGPKPGRKRMATVGAVYTVDPFVRTPENIVDALFQDPAAAKPETVKRPEPKNKRIFANLSRDDESGNEISATDLTMKEIAMQVQLRNPENSKVHIFLQDGQHALWEAVIRHFSENHKRIEILDLIHVMSYLWQAAALFFRSGWQQIAFMKDRALRILRGEVREVVSGMRQGATRRGFSKRQKKSLEKICNYFLKNQERMKYGEYLAAGYPIASGVIEGACRHYVKDRMERAGMRWSMEGAQAMLDVRSVALNGDWEEFVEFRIKNNVQKNHPHLSVVQAVQWPIAA